MMNPQHGITDQGEKERDSATDATQVAVSDVEKKEIQFTLDELKRALRDDPMAIFNAVIGSETVVPKPKIKDMVLQGGGPRARVYLGMLKALERHGVLDELEGVVGSSAGALTAFLVALGLSAEQIEELSRVVDTMDFVEARKSWFGNYFAGSKLGWILGAIWSGGAHTGTNAWNFFRMVSLLAVGKLDPTFNDLKEARKKNKFLKRLTCTITPTDPRLPHNDGGMIVTEDSDLEPRTFDWKGEAVRRGELCLTDAMLASIAMPVLFKSVPVHSRNSENKAHYLFDAVDGGCRKNWCIEAVQNDSSLLELGYQTVPVLNRVGVRCLYNPHELGVVLMDDKNFDPRGTSSFRPREMGCKRPVLRKKEANQGQRCVFSRDHQDYQSLSYSPARKGIGTRLHHGTKVMFSEVLRYNLGTMKLDEDLLKKISEHPYTTLALYARKISSRNLSIPVTDPLHKRRINRGEQKTEEWLGKTYRPTQEFLADQISKDNLKEAQQKCFKRKEVWEFDHESFSQNREEFLVALCSSFLKEAEKYTVKFALPNSNAEQFLPGYEVKELHLNVRLKFLKARIEKLRLIFEMSREDKSAKLQEEGGCKKSFEDLLSDAFQKAYERNEKLKADRRAYQKELFLKLMDPGGELSHWMHQWAKEQKEHEENHKVEAKKYKGEAKDKFKVIFRGLLGRVVEILARHPKLLLDAAECNPACLKFMLTSLKSTWKMHAQHGVPFPQHFYSLLHGVNENTEQLDSESNTGISAWNFFRRVSLWVVSKLDMNFNERKIEPVKFERILLPKSLLEQAMDSCNNETIRFLMGLLMKDKKDLKRLAALGQVDFRGCNLAHHLCSFGTQEEIIALIDQYPELFKKRTPSMGSPFDVLVSRCDPMLIRGICAHIKPGYIRGKWLDDFFNLNDDSIRQAVRMMKMDEVKNILLFCSPKFRKEVNAKGFSPKCSEKSADGASGSSILPRSSSAGHEYQLPSRAVPSMVTLFKKQEYNGGVEGLKRKRGRSASNSASSSSNGGRGPSGLRITTLASRVRSDFVIRLPNEENSKECETDQKCGEDCHEDEMEFDEDGCREMSESEVTELREILTSDRIAGLYPSRKNPFGTASLTVDANRGPAGRKCDRMEKTIKSQSNLLQETMDQDCQDVRGAIKMEKSQAAVFRQGRSQVLGL